MRVCGGKKVSSESFSIFGLFSGRGGEDGMSRNKVVLGSLYLRSNSSSLLSSALRLLYLRNNFSSLLSFHSIIGRLRLLYHRRNSSPPTLLSSSLLSQKLMLLLLLLLLLLSSSSLLSILFLRLSSLG